MRLMQPTSITHFRNWRCRSEEVKSNSSKYDLLDDQVVFLKGWFSETLPHADIHRVSVLRLDGDMYEIDHGWPDESVR